MNLCFDEKYILLIYYALYKKEYNPKDFNMSKISGHKVNHIKMHVGLYLAKELGLDIGDFGFIDSYYMPLSPGVEYILTVFDESEKSNDVNEFNKTLPMKIENNLLNINDLEILDKCSYILKDLTNLENGIEMLGSLLFKFRNVYKDFTYHDFFNLEAENYQKKYVLSMNELTQIFLKANSLNELLKQSKSELVRSIKKV